MRSDHALPPVPSSQAEDVAVELVRKLPAAALAGVIASLATAQDVQAADFAPPPTDDKVFDMRRESASSSGMENLSAPAVSDRLPEGNQWRYSDFIRAVQAGKVERVRFSKDGTQLQLTAVDGRRAAVVLPNDPELVDILAKNGVDISVSEASAACWPAARRGIAMVIFASPPRRPADAPSPSRVVRRVTSRATTWRSSATSSSRSSPSPASSSSSGVPRAARAGSAAGSAAPWAARWTSASRAPSSRRSRRRA